MQLEKTVRPRRAAEMLGVTKSLVCKWCRDGRLTAVKQDGDWHIEIDSVEEYKKLDRPTGAAGHRKNRN